jgi:serine/threonine-protein phosphatase PP1 catalytic subunit
MTDEGKSAGSKEADGKSSEKVGFDSSKYVNMEVVARCLAELKGARTAAPRTTVNLPLEDINTIINGMRDLFLNQPMLVETPVPITICGDTHGQFYDLLKIFEVCGWPPETRYIFLGDYVDRANQSIENMMLLLTLKATFPDDVHLLRGNHECASINRIYGFYDECKRRYHVRLWKTFADMFNCMPICGLIDGKILCMHGGISPELYDLKVIHNVKRPQDVPEFGLMCDLLWSDPEPELRGWAESERGVSYVFGYEVIEEFNRHHNLDLIVRAHQVVEDGYEFHANRQLVTIFSAPNYCGEFDNAGGLMQIDADMVCSFKIIKPSDSRKPDFYYKGNQ